MQRVLAACPSLIIAGWLVACAGQPEPGPEAAPKPTSAPEPEPQKLPFSDPRLMHEPASPVEADQIVTNIERGWPPPADDPLRNPSSLKDVLAILKLDQRNLFAQAIAFASTQNSLEAKALVAQIELAWGESYAILMDVLLVLGNHFDNATMHLEMKRQRNAAEEAELKRLQVLGQRVERVVMLFQVLNSDHIAKGAKLAAAVIKDHPESYLGYRLAADQYRILRDWEKFDLMTAKIEKTNPDSNGLRFLKGAAALQRDKDIEAAADYYLDALRVDPKFVRAQSHLVLCHDDLAGMYKELQELKRLNPNHQLVQWLDEAMELARSFSD